MGIFFGIILTIWISRISFKPVLTVNLTICFAYINFYICENICGVSGILSIVSMGLYMNYKGKTRVSVDAHHMLHNVWNLITFAAESGIFVLSGALVSTKGKNFFTF